MASAARYRKTELGQQEMSARRIKLAPRVRMMLVLVDGQTPTARLEEEARKIGAGADALPELERLRLIEPASAAAEESAPQGRPERFTAAKSIMTASASSFLGLKAFFFILKIEKAGDLAELAALIPELEEKLRAAAGEEEAAVIVGRLRTLAR